MIDDKIRIMIADSILASLEEDRKKHEGTVKLANKMLTMQKFVPFITVFLGFFISGLINSSDFIRFAMYGACVGIICAIPIKLFSYLYWGIIKAKNENKISEIDEKKEYVLAMKKAIENEMVKSNDKEMDLDVLAYKFVFVEDIQDVIEEEKQEEDTEKKVKKLGRKKKK